jgi:predicted transcriptional regulator of viral defense system
MKSFDLLKEIKKFERDFFTIEDLEKIAGFKRNYLYLQLNRWVKSGVLERIAKGIYIVPGANIEIEKVASFLYPPNYISFESALAHYGILNLVPYTLTFATTRRTKTYTIKGREVVFRQIKEDLFFGYTEKNGIYIATPGKAFLDQLYMVKKGLATIPMNEIDLKKLSKTRIKKLLPSFPDNVRNLAKNMGIA